MMSESTVIYNSAIEAAVRVLALLVELYPEQADQNKLVLLDYLLVHSGDAQGPVSLHPPMPHRTGEIVVRRGLLDQGLYILTVRNLAVVHHDESGISYSASEESAPFLLGLGSDYVLRLQEYATWVRMHFGTWTAPRLQEYFDRNLDRWGGEFTLASVTAEPEVDR
jgi:hypothetical protein